MALGSSGVLVGLFLFGFSTLKVQSSPYAQQAGLCSSQKLVLKKCPWQEHLERQPDQKSSPHLVHNLVLALSTNCSESPMVPKGITASAYSFALLNNSSHQILYPSWNVLALILKTPDYLSTLILSLHSKLLGTQGDLRAHARSSLGLLISLTQPKAHYFQRW